MARYPRGGRTRRAEDRHEAVSRVLRADWRGRPQSLPVRNALRAPPEKESRLSVGRVRCYLRRHREYRNGMRVRSVLRFPPHVVVVVLLLLSIRIPFRRHQLNFPPRNLRQISLKQMWCFLSSHFCFVLHGYPRQSKFDSSSTHKSHDCFILPSRECKEKMCRSTVSTSSTCVRNKK